MFEVTIPDTLEPSFKKTLSSLKADRLVERIWKLDHTVWKPEPAEIENRLGWLRVAEEMSVKLDSIRSLVDAVRGAGYDRALLLGMGGSSLAPEVFRNTFGVGENYLDLAVLDSTDPGAVLERAENLDLNRTLFIVATKSGGTVETLSFFKYFYNKVAEAVGKGKAGQHFIAVTDPGSSLTELAARYGFRETFLNDPEIGGRYSALSFFGLVPAALIGVDLEGLLDRARTAASACRDPDDNPAASLGTVMGAMAKAGRDKLTFVISPPIASFGDWIEQLIGESTGKEGKGILPVVGEPPGTPQVYGADRLFIYLRLAGDETYNEAVRSLEEAGQPVLKIQVDDLYDLGGQFFFWEMATAVAGAVLEINPFDQPNVEAAKIQARRMVEAFRREGKLPELQPVLEVDGITVYGKVKAQSPGSALAEFLKNASPGAYVSLQAYLPPSRDTDESILSLRRKIRDRTRLATTAGYGPRFLHSTGQLHKGDAGRGLFIQFTARPLRDAPIPDEAGTSGSSLTFGILEASQSLGDRQALLDSGRSVIRFDLGGNVERGLKRLGEALS